MAVIRAATTVELAANLVVREELENGQKLPREFVEHLLKWANGLLGKLDKLIIPITEGTDRGARFKALKKQVAEINTQRNGVAHRGEFKIKKTSSRILDDARNVILALVQQYDAKFFIPIPDNESEDENP